MKDKLRGARPGGSWPRCSPSASRPARHRTQQPLTSGDRQKEEQKESSRRACAFKARWREASVSRLRAAALRNFLSVVDSIRKGSDTSGRVLARLGSLHGPESPGLLGRVGLRASSPECWSAGWAGGGAETLTSGRRGHPVPAACEAGSVLKSRRLQEARSFPKLRTGHAEDEGPLDPGQAETDP